MAKVVGFIQIESPETSPSEKFHISLKKPCSTAAEAETLFWGTPCKYRERLNKFLIEKTVANWGAGYASWDGKPYEYDNGPWPKQDRFYRFADGSVCGVIWDFNGRISVRHG